MINKILAIIILLSINVFVASAQNYGRELKDINELSLKLKKAGEKTNSIICDFKQTKNMKVLAKPAISKGTFTYKESEIRLDYIIPSGDYIYLSEDKFKISNNGKTTIITSKFNPMLKHLRAMLNSCMTGDLTKLQQGGKIDYFYNNNSYVLVINSNSKLSNYLQKIVLIFDSADMTLNSMQMCENETDYTLYEFFNKKIN